MMQRRWVKPPTIDEERALVMRMRAGDVSARDELIERNHPLVIRVARGLGYWLTEDMIQEGEVGLVIAAGRYDPSFGTRFSTYAWQWIRQKLQVHVAANAMVPLSPRQAKAIRATKAAGEESRHATVRCVDPTYLRALAAEDRGDGRADAAGTVRAALDELEPRLREVLTSRAGIGRDPEGLQQIGDRLGICKERVRQLECRAIEAMAFKLTRRKPALPSMAAVDKELSA